MEKTRTPFHHGDWRFRQRWVRDGWIQQPDAALRHRQPVLDGGLHLQQLEGASLRGHRRHQLRQRICMGPERGHRRHPVSGHRLRHVPTFQAVDEHLTTTSLRLGPPVLHVHDHGLAQVRSSLRSHGSWGEHHLAVEIFVTFQSGSHCCGCQLVTQGQRSGSAGWNPQTT